MAITTEKKNIVLIGEGSVGHHLAFMNEFCNSLLRLGHNVIVLTPDIDIFRKNLKKEVFLFERRYFGKKVPSSLTQLIIKIIFDWRQLSKQVKAIETEMEIKIDLVFFSWLDSYLANKFPHFLLPYIFKYSWSGLYFHPTHLRLTPNPQISIGSIDAILLAKNCKGIGFHDEYVVNVFKGLKTKAVFFPEISDFTPPNLQHKYFKDIKKYSNGRMIFGTVGPELRKNVLLLVRLAIHYQNDSRFFFVFAGKWNLDGYSDLERNDIQLFKKSGANNIFIIEEYILEGEPINSLLSAMDVIFIYYKNFMSTSNYSTKASFLKKLVISSDRFIIGEETEKYALGILVDENNFEQLIESVEIIHRDYELLKSKANFDEYLKKHSLTELDKSFAAIITT